MAADEKIKPGSARKIGELHQGMRTSFDDLHLMLNVMENSGWLKVKDIDEINRVKMSTFHLVVPPVKVSLRMEAKDDLLMAI